MISKEQLLEEELKKHVVSINIKGEVAYLAHLADIHAGLCNRTLFEETFLSLAKIPNLYFGLGGDSTNGITKWSKGSVLEEWCSGDRQIYYLAEFLKPYKDKILYIIDGNHGAGRQKNESYITPEMMLATLLGKPEIYKEEMVFVYFNVNKNCYVHFAQHKAGKRAGIWDNFRYDVCWREHHHEFKTKESVVVEHNKYAKKPIVKTTYEVSCGSFLVYPSYAKANGYFPQIPGCFICEMSGERTRRIQIWKDTDLLK